MCLAHTTPSHFICNEFVCSNMHSIYRIYIYEMFQCSHGNTSTTLLPLVQATFFFSLQINFNLTQFQRSYFTMPFRLIENANAHSLTHTNHLRVHLTLSHLRHTKKKKTFTANSNIYDFLFSAHKKKDRCVSAYGSLKMANEKSFEIKRHTFFFSVWFSYFPLDKFLWSTSLLALIVFTMERKCFTNKSNYILCFQTLECIFYAKLKALHSY